VRMVWLVPTTKLGEADAAGDTVLDLGTGTADVAIEVARSLRKRGGGGALAADAVVGVDPRSPSDARNAGWRSGDKAR